MLTDKQSLFLCSFVVIGFVAAGILDMLDSFIVLGFLSLAFLAVIINIFIVNPFEEEEVEIKSHVEKTSTQEEE